MCLRRNQIVSSRSKMTLKPYLEAITAGLPFDKLKVPSQIEGFKACVRTRKVKEVCFMKMIFLEY